MHKQRRNFLKITAAGATGLALLRPNRALAAWPSSGTLTINPDISNTLVVACTDTAMMKTNPASMTFSAVNAAVDSARVAANMDAMAMALANTTSADAAWKKIFRSSKAWASTVVAIKVNGIEPKNMARVAVLQKFCSVLAALGVTPANIIIYDGSSMGAGGMSNYTSLFSVTDTSKIQAVIANSFTPLGGTTSAKLPDGSSANCAADIANGKVDVLINVANNKGHALFGGSTLCMKNHFGTFDPNHTNLASYVFATNKSDAIVGGTPVRQQLCFVDSLVANKASNAGTPEAMPCYLIMGTCAPIVDYLTVKKVREAVMNATHDSATVNSFLTSFGYSTSDPQWVLVPPASGGGEDAGIGGSSGTGTGGTPGNGGSSGTSRPDAGGTVRADAGSGTGGATGGGPGAGGSNVGGARAGGAGGSGGATAAAGTGGAGKGGASAGTGSGTGGTSTRHGSGGTTASGSGGASSATSAGTTTESGCGCDVGGLGGAGRLGTLLVVGAAVAGQVGRLAARKRKVAQESLSEAAPLPQKPEE